MKRLPALLCPIACALLLILSGFAHADIYMELKVQTRTLDKDQQPHSPASHEQWIWASDSKLRSETRDVISLVDLESGLMQIITPAARSYMEMPLGATLKDLGMDGEMEIQVEDLGQSKDMNGKLAHAYRQIVQSPLGEVETIIWATEDIDVEHPELLANTSLAALGMLQQADAATLARAKQEMAKIRGVPLVSMSSMAMGEATQQTMVSLVAITEEEAPEEAWLVPAGYEKMVMPGMESIVGSSETEPEGKEETIVSAVATGQVIEAPPHDVVMTEISDAGMGYTIRVPEGYETLRKIEFAHTFTKVLPGGLHEYNVNLSPLEASTMDDAISNATMVGGKKLDEQRDLGNGFYILKSARGVLQELWVFRNGASKSVAAKCQGPKDGLAVLIDMCGSLQVMQ